MENIYRGAEDIYGGGEDIYGGGEAIYGGGEAIYGDAKHVSLSGSGRLCDIMLRHIEQYKLLHKL